MRRASFLERRSFVDLGPLLGTWSSNHKFEAAWLNFDSALSYVFTPNFSRQTELK